MIAVTAADRSAVWCAGGDRGCTAGVYRRRTDHNERMDVTAKLQIKPGQRVAALAGAGGDVPRVVAPDANPAAEPGSADVVVAFARNQAEIDSVAAPAIEAARQDRLAWIAYPKAGQLGTEQVGEGLVGQLGLL